MTNLIETIKRIAINAVAATKPVEIIYGIVVSVEPLLIKLSQNQIYPKDYFVISSGGGSFAIGDILILLRVQGGQQFLIYGKKGEL